MAISLDRDRLIEAFERLGADLAGRGVFVELAVYGGGALLLLFEWRRTPENVDAVVREGFGEFALAPSVLRVAEALGMDPYWLNNAVGAYMPLDEADALFEASGSYPTASAPGLRIVIAKPCYLLAVKLQALANLDRGDRNLDDARALARHLGLDVVEGLHRIYRSIYDEDPPVAHRGVFRPCWPNPDETPLPARGGRADARGPAARLGPSPARVPRRLLRRRRRR